LFCWRGSCPRLSTPAGSAGTRSLAFPSRIWLQGVTGVAFRLRFLPPPLCGLSVVFKLGGSLRRCGVCRLALLVARPSSFLQRRPRCLDEAAPSATTPPARRARKRLPRTASPSGPAGRSPFGMIRRYSISGLRSSDCLSQCFCVVLPRLAACGSACRASGFAGVYSDLGLPDRPSRPRSPCACPQLSSAAFWRIGRVVCFFFFGAL